MPINRLFDSTITAVYLQIERSTSMRTIAISTILLLSVSVAQASDALVARATKFVDKHPSVTNRVGLAEIQRTNGMKQAAIDELQKLPKNAEVLELLCWRSLPVAAKERDAFRKLVAQLKEAQPANPWVAIFELCVIADDADRRTFQAAIEKAPASVPTRFPIAMAESAHRELLQELGHSRVQAGMEVITGRGFEALHALRDLDRAMTREAEALRDARNDALADRVLTLRNRFREAYRRASSHLVEGLFALNLNGETKERDALLAKAKALPYLHERRRLLELLDRMEEADGWKLLIEPLLTSELALVDNPPNLTRFLVDGVAQLQIKARSKTVKDDVTHYRGSVSLRLHGIDVTCEQLTIVNAANPAAIILTGNDDVHLRGFRDYPLGVSADRFTYHAESGAFTLGGDIRLRANDKIVKLRSCTLTQRGELRDPRSLLDDFRSLFTLDAKLELLPKIAKTYDDAELPDEVRFLLAMHLLRPHLSWQAPFVPPVPERDPVDRLRRLEKLVKQERHHGLPWQEAMGGEKWMLDEISEKVEANYRETLRAWYAEFAARHKKAMPLDLPIPGKDLYFWRIDKRQHPDVVRAHRLLEGVRAEDLSGKAYRWREEIGRNNTVITFDIAGAAAQGRAHTMLMDVRNAERVAFKLYRVQTPEELLYATKNIGTDFIYRDHHLDDDDMGLRIDKSHWDRAKHLMRKMQDVSEGNAFIPHWKPAQLVREWNAKVSELKVYRGDRGRRSWRWRENDWYDEPDSGYFDDECSLHQDRFEKQYRPLYENQLSSWQCDRLVRIPENVLRDGAYVLVAEANGQVAHVPIVVEPLSVTLRRCRDGVFVQASDAEGKKPLEGARVYGQNLRGDAVTDKQGVAFARMLAYGDRALVVHHEGRYAIGGFGQVFEGIYENDDEEEHLRDAMKRLRRARTDRKETMAFGYADRHVVAAYTDRPTYRPGQDVQFKLMVRKLIAEKAEWAETNFRGDDFDRPTRIAMPNTADSIVYSIFDPKGNNIASGAIIMSDFGTGASSVRLNTESVHGSYSMRIRLAGHDRLIPDVFAVKHYRRPNFEVKVAGVPAKLTKPDKLSLEISSQYYFGPPVANGTAELRVLRNGFRKTIVHDSVKLDDKGLATIDLQLPKSMEAGKYTVHCTITEDSGRAVSSASPMTLESPNVVAGGSGLSTLPRFIAMNQELKFETSAREVIVEQDLTSLVFKAKEGSVTLKLSGAGWYRVKADSDETMLFVYGGTGHPRSFHVDQEIDDETGRPSRQARWVNLSDYRYEEDGPLSRWERPSQHVYALFDKQSVKLGDKLRLLVYVPEKEGKLLFTFEGRTILDYAVANVSNKTGAYQIVELPIKERHFPNFYLQGRFLAIARGPRAAREPDKLMKAIERLERDDDEDSDPRWCRVDVLKPKSAIEQGTLKVQIETDQPKYKPGDAVRATVKVTDHAGKPKAAELSLAAIDESVYAFGEDNLDALAGFFKSPHEARRFQSKPWRVSLGSRWSKKTADAKKGEVIQRLQKAIQNMAHQQDAIQDLAKASLDERGENFIAIPLPRLGGEMPTSQIPLPRLREHFQETAAWLPQVRTDDTGTARLSFTLPDSLTRYRLTSIALTKETEIGVGRARITAALPLAVQVFVPRFAVEKDRLQAVAVVHNHTDKARECEFTWDIDGATLDGGEPKGKIKVAASSSAKVSLWLKAEKLGIAKIKFRAIDGSEGDEERRALPVHPLGRPADVNRNETLEVLAPNKAATKDVVGKFNKEGRIKLPAGFIARELHLSLAVSDVAQSLEGLDYLVDYPYGCIEQTMSRFLPVVMIKHATKQAPVTLQPEIAAKLPDILREGLARLAGHQHTDGSWGWFEKDSRNLAMSVYVVYGLARCQSTGTKVDAEVMRRGCAYLRTELRTGKHEPELVARTWYALALAGHAETKELEAVARQALKQNVGPNAACNLALACRTQGLRELSEQLWSKARGWQTSSTEELALKLNAQIAFGAKYNECHDTAHRLLARRQGTRWYHTRDTSWAIEALSGMLAYVPERNLVRRVEVTLAGKKVLEVTDANDLKKMTFRLHLKGDQVPLQDGLELRMHVDSDNPVHVAFRAVGVQRLDDVKPTGTNVRLQRMIETLDGETVRGPLKIGQVVRVRLRLDLQDRQDYLLIEDRRPSLCEFADDHLGGASARAAVHQEFRDDRLSVFFRSLSAGTHEIVYYLRAETAGQCVQLPGAAYPMYDEKQRGETGANRWDVK